VKRKTVPGPVTKSATRELTIRRLQSTDWPIVEKLFGANGACGGCWCMWWRLPVHGKAWKEAKGERNQQALRSLIEAGQVHAMLAFAGEEPVGWLCFGPRKTFPFLDKSRVLQTGSGDGTWSMVCFYIPSRWRGQGVASQMLAAGTKEAFARGATEIEAYPAVPSSGPLPAAFAYTGVPKLFEKAGYKKIRRPTGQRPIYIKGR
jgi:ribosomal protein S18 acetylase RimI-like enzyme